MVSHGVKGLWAKRKRAWIYSVMVSVSKFAKIFKFAVQIFCMATPSDKAVPLRKYIMVSSGPECRDHPGSIISIDEARETGVRTAYCWKDGENHNYKID